MKNILVPTDYSKNAYAALFYASKLFAEENVHFSILHSFEEDISRLTSRIDEGKTDVFVAELTKNSDKVGEELIKKLRENVNNNAHSYEVISTASPLTGSINKLVSTEGTDLVVVGSKGRTAAADVLMGSTTNKIIQTLQGCPLLIVPQHVDFVIPANIAFATDFNEFYQLTKLKPITRLVRHFRSQIYILHVGAEKDLNPTQLKNLEQFKNDLSEYDTEFRFVPKVGNVSTSIHKFVDEQRMDLLTLVFHKHAFIKALFREPVVNRVGKHSHVPTLVIPVKMA